MAGIHILQVSKSTGGVGQYVRCLVNGIDKQRFEITAVCLSEDGDKLATELSQIEGVQAVSLQMERYKINLLSDIKVWWQLYQLIKRGNFDVIHAHASKPGFLTRIAAALTRSQVVYSPHGFSFHPGVARWKAVFFAMLERIAAKLCTARIIALCSDEKELAMSFQVGSDDQITTLYTGVDLDSFKGNFNHKAVRETLGVPAESFLFGTVGRLSKQKAPEDFVNAAVLVRAHYPNVHFVWVGNGELKAETEELVRLMGLENVFHLVGLRQDIPAVLNTIDCFVLASHWEGFSLSVLEAMAAGRPVIMSRVSGAAEAVLNGKTGLIVPIGDEKALADAMKSISANPEKAAMMGKAGLLRAERKFNLSRMISDIQELYEEINAISLEDNMRNHARKSI